MTFELPFTAEENMFFGSLEQDMNRNVDTWKLLSGSLLLTMKIFEDAVDGRNPAFTSWFVYSLSVYPIIFPGFVHLRWLFGISSNPL